MSWIRCRVQSFSACVLTNPGASCCCCCCCCCCGCGCGFDHQRRLLDLCTCTRKLGRRYGRRRRFFSPRFQCQMASSASVCLRTETCWWWEPRARLRVKVCDCLVCCCFVRFASRIVLSCGQHHAICIQSSLFLSLFL